MCTIHTLAPVTATPLEFWMNISKRVSSWAEAAKGKRQKAKNKKQKDKNIVYFVFCFIICDFPVMIVSF